jgi:plasmid segregation protein ParM
MNRSKCIGIDVGYGYSKVVMDSHDGVSRTVWPSVVGNFEAGTVEVEGMKSSASEYVEVENQKLLVGKAALKHSFRLFNAREKNWIGSVAYRALMKNAIQNADLHSINLIITSGLPVSYYKTDKGKLTNIIREIAKEKAITVTAKIIPQPLGSFFNLLFDETGMVQDEGLVNTRVGVLDIGFYTVDLITIDNLELVEKQIASFENGVAGILESIARDIENAYDFRPDLHKTEEAIRKGSIRVYGTDHDITEIAKQRLTELATEIEARAKTIWKTAADLDQVVLTGGGAILLKSYLDLYRHTIVIEDAQFANVMGYYKYAKRINYGE